ncbi:MAG: polyprenyl synthetase family protein [Clostridia bacterium]|nr:polyprenyl synthetase family protein [Clostridia bacterium]
MSDFLQKYKIYEGEFERALVKYCAEMNYQPSILTESMRYSLLLGGKRIRPVLFLSTLDAYGYDYQTEMNFALALECIHTYSLIHDDLPVMDNDDFRRGKPSSHRAFGEANAILAGDALLSLAFDLLLSDCGKSPRHLAAAQELSRAAGAEGMIAGQSADIYFTGGNAGREELDFIYNNKTGKLLVAPS